MTSYICIYNKRDNDLGVYLIENNRIVPAPSFPTATSLDRLMQTINERGLLVRTEYFEGKNVAVTLKSKPPEDPATAASYFQQLNYDAIVLNREQARIWVGVHQYQLPETVKTTLLKNLKSFTAEVTAAIIGAFKQTSKELHSLTEKEKALEEQQAILEGQMMSETEKIIQKYAVGRT